MTADKLILITGGNKGIGREICAGLLAEASDVHVLMTARSIERDESGRAYSSLL
jgi:NAD(P)-dependent dehydrogenase (short-subunit alcohol dehydrogenase family)